MLKLNIQPTCNMKCVGVQSKHHGNHTYDVTFLLAAMTDVRLSIHGHAEIIT